MGYETVGRLASSFCRLPNLKYLNLAYHAMGTKGALALAEGLQHTPHLRHLDLDGNNIGDEGICALAGVFCKTPKLEYLALLSSCGMSTLALGRTFKHLHQLKSLSVSSWSPAGKTPISYHLRDLRKLKTLRALGPINADGMWYLGGSLGRIPQIQHLGLLWMKLWEGAMDTLELTVTACGGKLPEEIKLVDRATILTSRKCTLFKRAVAEHGLEERRLFAQDARRLIEDKELRLMKLFRLNCDDRLELHNLKVD